MRGNVVMEGYYNDPDATAAAFAGGWFHSGDGAVVHPDGYVEIRDRFKDVIISGGENISSVEVEGVLLQHPAVVEAAVVGVPDANMGRSPACLRRVEAGRRGHRGGAAGVRAEPAGALQGATRLHVCSRAAKDGDGQDPEIRAASGPSSRRSIRYASRPAMIFRAPEPPVVIPEVALTPFLLEHAVERGDKPAFIDGPSGRTLTYRGWADGVRRVATGLAARGFGKGDVFAIYSPNVPEYAVAFHAVSLAGGINTTISPLYTVSELSEQLRDSGARYLVTVPGCFEKAEQAARESGVREVFVFGETERGTPFGSLFAAECAPPAVQIDPREDLVVIPYSSGTTGLPKGVMLTHYNLVANILQSAGVVGLREDDILLGVLPFFHIYGMTVIMNLALHVGATVVTMPRFDLEQCLETLQKYRVTFANVVPPIVLALAKHPLVDKYELTTCGVCFQAPHR